ncbi:MAG: hypothetical protein H7Z43_04190, partial [Clostridia bacterium]|nr:hypothetical protein [Deltaproteobacteria bacterium]
MTGLTRWGVLLVFLAGCRPAAIPAHELLVVTGLKGTTEPCGCTSHPLGGLDRLVGRLDALRPAMVAFVGDTFFTPGAPQEQEPSKARLIEEVLKRLRPDFVVTGAIDAVHQKMETAATRIVTIDRTRVAVASQQRLDCAALTTLPKADARVLLLAEESHDCDPPVDIVVVPGGEEPRGPRELGKSLWIDAGDR